MEGTVTIKLNDYECLKANAENMKHYLELASRQIDLIGRIEEYFQTEDLAGFIGSPLMEDIDRALKIWHG